jgi:hypothetical protein
MAGTTVLIGSKLPNGLIIRHPLKAGIEAEIRGLNGAPKGRSGQLMVVPYMTTEIDKDLWDAWFLVHGAPGKIFPPIKSGAIFVARTPEAAEKIYREREKEITGLEPMKQVGDDRLGLDKKKLSVATEDND